MLEGFSCAAAGGVSFSTEGFSVAVTGACANVTLLLDVPYWGPSVGRLSSRLLLLTWRGSGDAFRTAFGYVLSPRWAGCVSPCWRAFGTSSLERG